VHARNVRVAATRKANGVLAPFASVRSCSSVQSYALKAAKKRRKAPHELSRRSSPRRLRRSSRKRLDWLKSSSAAHGRTQGACDNEATNFFFASTREPRFAVAIEQKNEPEAELAGSRSPKKPVVSSCPDECRRRYEVGQVPRTFGDKRDGGTSTRATPSVSLTSP
jgi:hypothetical protein